MKKIVIALSVVAALAFVVVFAKRVGEARDRNADKPVDQIAPAVSTVVAAKRDFPEMVSITGTVRAANEAAVFAKMPGRVTKVNVEIGTMVKAGDVLAALESNDLSWRVKQAEAQLMAARAGLENAQVQQKTATSSWTRAQALHSKGSMSQADFEQAQAGFELSKVGVKAAEAQVALAEAAVGLANQAFADSRITSPIAGVVSKKNVEVGTQAGPGQPAFVVQDQTTLKMQGSVAANEVALVKKGQPVKVRVDELPGKKLDGEVAHVAPSLDDITRRATIEVALKPADGLLPYMFGHAEIAFGTRAGAIVIPANAVITTPDGAIVYAVRNGKAVVLKPRVGPRFGDDVFIEAGIEDGDHVVVSGDTGLRDGIAVQETGSKSSGEG